MANKYDRGVVEGIKIQKKAEQKVREKELKAEETAAQKWENRFNSQDEINDILIDDKEEEEGKTKFGLKRDFNINELDVNERRFLINALYSLFEDEVSVNQQNYFNNLRNHLGVTEKPTEADLSNIKNVDSIEQKEAIWYCICEFLFLKDCQELSVEKYKNIFDYYELKSERLEEKFETINSLYGKLGAEFFVSNFLGSSSDNFSDEDEEADIQEETEEYFEEDDLDLKDELESIIQKYITKIGKSLEDSFDLSSEIKERFDFKKKDADSDGDAEETRIEKITKVINKLKLAIVPDSVVEIRKISGGYIIFTTYAIYLPDKNGYAEIPYKSIKKNLDKLKTSKGKHKKESMLTISYTDSDGNEQLVNIDNSKVEEEVLQSLLTEICGNNIEYAETDKAIAFDDLPEEALVLFVALLVYILKSTNSNLMEAYVLASRLKVFLKWKDICSLINNEKEYDECVAKFRMSIPYPSEKSISVDACELVLNALAATQWLKGEDNKGAATLNPKETELVRKLYFVSYKRDAFNAIRDDASFYLEMMLGHRHIRELEKIEAKRIALFAHYGISAGQYLGSRALAIFFGKTLLIPGLNMLTFSAYTGIMAGVAIKKHFDNQKLKESIISNMLEKYMDCKERYIALQGNDDIYNAFGRVVEKIKEIQNK